MSTTNAKRLAQRNDDRMDADHHIIFGKKRRVFETLLRQSYTHSKFKQISVCGVEPSGTSKRFCG